MQAVRSGLPPAVHCLRRIHPRLSRGSFWKLRPRRCRLSGNMSSLYPHHHVGPEQGAVRDTSRDMGNSLHIAASAYNRVGVWNCGSHLPLMKATWVRSCLRVRVFNLHFKPVWRQLPERLELLLKNLIELLAAVPGVVYAVFRAVDGLVASSNLRCFGWMQSE